MEAQQHQIKNTIKDKQKLFRKLFISPSYQPQNQIDYDWKSKNHQAPLLVSPDFINLLLQESASASKQYQFELIDEILSIFEKKQINSLLLYRVDRQNKEYEKCILDGIVFKLVKLVQTPLQVQKYLRKIKDLLRYYKISIKNISKLTKYISKAIYLQKLDPIKFKFIIKILKLYYEQKSGMKNSPSNYFYCLGSQNSYIQPKQYTSEQLCFKNQLTLVIVFKPQAQQICQPQINNIISISTDVCGQLGIQLIGRKIILRHINAQGQVRYSQQIFEQIQSVWYRLVVVMNQNTTQCYLDDKHYFQFKPVLHLLSSTSQQSSSPTLNSPKNILGFNFNKLVGKKSGQYQLPIKFIKQCLVGHQFQGMLGNVIIANKCWNIWDKFSYDSYQYGLNSWDSLILLNKTNQIHNSIIYCCLPFTCYSSRQYLIAFDVFKKNHSLIGDNIYCFQEMKKSESIVNLGGIKIILPFIYIARFYSPQKQPNLLVDILDLILLIFKTYDSNSLQEQLKNTNGLQILGQHLQQLHQFQNVQTLGIIYKLYRRIRRQDLKKKFIWSILWKINIGFQIKSSQQMKYTAKSRNIQIKNNPCSQRTRLQQTIKAHYELILKLYQNERKLCLQGFSFQEIIYWIFQNLETSSQIQNNIHNCCVQHYMSELSLAQQKTYQKQQRRIYNNFVGVCLSVKKYHYEYLESILFNILEYMICKQTVNTKNTQNIQQQIEDTLKVLLRLFLRKYSTCLYIMVLTIIKRLINRFKNQRYIVQVMENQNLKLLDFFALLADRTLHPTIISNIIYIVGFLKLNTLKKRRIKLYQEFIIYLIKRYGSIIYKQCRSFNIAKLIQRNRKKSQDNINYKLYKYENEQFMDQLAINPQYQQSPSICKRSKQRIQKQIKQMHQQKKTINIQQLDLSHNYTLSTYLPLYNIIFNLLGNLTSQQNPQLHNFIINDKSSIQLLAQYYQLIACQQFQQNILINILSCVQSATKAVIGMPQLHEFILSQIYKIMIKQENEHTRILFKHMITIYTAMLSYILNNKTQKIFDKNSETMLSFYCLIKSINPISTSYILLDIIPTMIKSMDMNQLIQIMLIVNFEKDILFRYLQQLNFNKLGLDCFMKKKCVNMGKIIILLLNQIYLHIDTEVGSIQKLYILMGNPKNIQKIKQLCQKYQNLQIFNIVLQQQKQGSQIFSIDVILSKLYAKSATYPQSVIIQEQQDIINKSQQISPLKFPIKQSKPLDFNLIAKQFQQIYQTNPNDIERIENQNTESILNTEYQYIFCSTQLQKDTQNTSSKYLQGYLSKSMTTLQFMIDFVYDILYKKVKTQNEEQYIGLVLQNVEIDDLQRKIDNIVLIYCLSTIYSSQNPSNKLHLRLILYYYSYYSMKFHKMYQNSAQIYLQIWSLLFNYTIFPFFNQQYAQVVNNYVQLIQKIKEIGCCPLLIEDIQLFLNYSDFQQFKSLYRKWKQLDSNPKIRVDSLAKILQQQNFKQRLNFKYLLLDVFDELKKLNILLQKSLILEQMFEDYSELNEEVVDNKDMNEDCKQQIFDMYQSQTKLQKYTKLQIQNLLSKNEINKLNLANRTYFKNNKKIKGPQKNMKIMKKNSRNQASKNIKSQQPSKQHIEQSILTKYLAKTQKLFQNQSTLQQKTRIRYLYNTQCRFRKIQSLWNQMWNNLRIYHHPYGFWMAQKNSVNNQAYTHHKNHKLKNFKFQISQTPTTSGLYPILQAKMLQPWHIIKDQRRQSKKYYNSFSEMISSPHLQNKKKSNHNNNFLTQLWKNVWGIPKKSSTVNKQYEVLWISRSQKASGKLYIQNKEQLIFTYDSTRQDDSHLAFQKFILEFNKQTYKRWTINKIQKIRYHRYLLKYSGICISLTNSNQNPCQLIFNFINEDKKQFLKELQKIYKQKYQNQNYYKVCRTNRVPFFMDNVFDYQYTSEIKQTTEKWKKREISNLQYLLKLNKFAFRGIYDMSQYPVMPWVTEMKASQKEPILRNLTKTMGALGSEDRKKILMEKYHSHDPFNPYPPFFYGTHYSSPGVIFNFLIRLSPFTQYCKQLQGGKFDIPDRLFSSLMNCWKSATQQVSDVRELIPEFYYMPETLINIDENYFGMTQLGQQVNNVDLPIWGAKNPYYFVMQLKIMMQCQDTSNKLNQWIDLIFGYKQKGKEAEQALNIYYYLTYQQSQQDQMQEDQVYQKSKQAQIMHFGQMPPILFDKPHTNRIQVQNNGKYELYFTKKYIIPNMKQKPFAIFATNSGYHETLIVKSNQFQVVSLQANPCSLLRAKKINLQKSIKEQYYLIKKQKIKIMFFSKSGNPKISTSANNFNDICFILVYGYIDHQFRIYSSLTNQVAESDQLDAEITSCYVNQTDQLIIFGLATGILVVYEIQYGVHEIIIHKIASQVFPAPIMHISYHDGFYSISFGNYCGIYKIYRTINYVCNNSINREQPLKFFRSFYNNLPINSSYIVFSPLPCIVLTDNANIKVYSINGQLLKIKTLPSKILSVQRFRDKQFNELLCVFEDDKYSCLTIPDLRTVSMLQIYNDNSYAHCFINDTKNQQKIHKNNDNRKIQWILDNGIIGGSGWISFLKWGPKE